MPGYDLSAGRSKVSVFKETDILSLHLVRKHNQSINKPTRWLQSVVSAMVLSVNRLICSRITQRRGDWSGRTSPRRDHLSWILKHEKQPPSIEEELSKQRNLQLQRVTVEERLADARSSKWIVVKRAERVRQEYWAIKQKGSHQILQALRLQAKGLNFIIIYLHVCNATERLAGVKTASCLPISLIRNILKVCVCVCVCVRERERER